MTNRPLWLLVLFLTLLTYLSFALDDRHLELKMSACNALSTALGESKVFGPNDPAFIESTTSYFSAFENELKPACIIRPTCAKDVSVTLSTFKPYADCGEQLAIRGGGHMSGPGSANINNGVTIDMRGLTGIEVDNDEKVVKIASGEYWANVYEKLDPMGLGLSGGRAAKVGVGGFVLGGGLSFFSSEKGFVCDSVANFECVLADGQIVNANSNENKDLWLALRGGGNNFCIVTRYDMGIFKQGDMWGGSIFYDISTLPQQFQALYDFTTDPHHDTASHFILSAGVNHGFTAVMNNIYYAKPEPNPPALQRFTSIQPQLTPLSTLRIDSLKNFAHEQSALSVNGLRQKHMTTSFKASVELMSASWALFQAALDKIKDVPGLAFALAYQPFPNALLKSSASHGGNSLGLEPDVDGPIIMVCLFSQWANKEDDEKVLSTEWKLVKEINIAAETKKLEVGYLFMNYCFEGQDPISGYGEASKKKLRDASKKYDPEGFFQKSVPGGFKLS